MQATPSHEVLTKGQLARLTGADGSGPLYLAILGQVFDVTSNWGIYGAWCNLASKHLAHSSWVAFLWIIAAYTSTI